MSPGGRLPAVFGVSLEVRAGEILGIAGVSGNGQTELIEAIAGLRPVDGGHSPFSARISPTQRARTPRKRDGAHSRRPDDDRPEYDDQPGRKCHRQRYQKAPIPGAACSTSAYPRSGAEIIDAFQLKSAHVGDEIKTLSGGNLQKIVLGRELDGSPKFIIANQPTRGLDVGSIEFVHQTLVDQRDAGAALLLVSVELDEIFSLSDRIAVMFEGRIMAVLDTAEATEENVVLLMAGGTTRFRREKVG